ncbi:NAD(P)-binding protein [Sistotremastrum niveocremeum HHB9708]|uniref:NAD(P)-binding protein n=1 Tax=Sistotremastrum niveocremeum HHB9708 TaxID=1314777 RepID=A0A164QVD8_9AGAM|nr:NAD(P)-binding protein [Sistotremastrum niveocremeum HHB9708]
MLSSNTVFRSNLVLQGILISSSRPGALASRAALRRFQSTAKAEVKALPSFSLQDKVCVVTGAARGLGNEFCRAFVQSGCNKLGIVDLREDQAQEAAKALINDLETTGEIAPGSVDAFGYGCDVGSETSVKKVFQDVSDRWGRVDCVVASAGIVENYSAFDYPSDRVKRLYDINVHGAFFTAREAARIMTAQKSGSIVLVASMSAHIVNIPQHQTPYNASKAAVKHMAASLAVEWAKEGVRVNTLSPGYMLTALTKQVLSGDPELKKTWEALTPMGRMGEPDDLKGAIVFLASDASRFMTGADLRVDGGYCLV